MPRAVARINARSRNLPLGNLGDIKPVRGGPHELHVHYGSGFRLYVLREGQTVIVLCAGDEASQERDIERAGELADDWRQR
ncbi:MAG: type II toxin-antitoxin system RelE/ParE family toxin [Rhodospirillales bacterium]|nr:type II toxin-antitoxin system RelE/ParE family toxin [Rhodospirillales bacterium]